MYNTGICGVVVLYNPEGSVADNIATYAASLERLYIIDNSDGLSAFAAEQFGSAAILLAQDGNIGVAAALNMALERAYKEGYQWMLTMDQDGSFDPFELTRLLRCSQAVSSQKVLLFSPVHNKKFLVQSDTCRYEEAEAVMTSGNLVNVGNAKAIGGYDIRLFIDEVDHEFCLRGRLGGYRVVSMLSVYVNHQLGMRYPVKGRHVRLYPPERLYYMMRNYLFLRQKYAGDYADFFEKRTRFLTRFFYQHLRYSPKRFSSLLMLLKGWYDYKRNRLGPYNDSI